MPRDKAPQMNVEKEMRAYFAALSPDVRRALKKLEKMVHAAAPRAAQGFSYRMPCVRIDDRPVVWYAGFKRHVSMFPMTAPIVRAHAAALRGYEKSTGTIRFPLDELPSAALVKKLVASRLLEMHKATSRSPRRGRKRGKSRGKKRA
jgi:uncharacterized protein YdhG (YjbR/CyaY superfamily)